MPSSPSLRIGLAQVNFTVGDLQGNRNRILHGIKSAKALDCDWIAFPELCITGYPPEDLLLRRQFVRDQFASLREIAVQVHDLVAVVGFVRERDNELYNSAAVVQNGEIKAVYDKIHLPNYSVFDEDRYFISGDKPLIVIQGNAKIGISICEDIWIPESVVETEALCGRAEILLNISASPYHHQKGAERERLMSERAKRNQAFVAYVNLVGGQDELVFDGQSMFVDETGTVVAVARSFEEDLLVYDVDVERIHKYRSKSSIFSESARKFGCPYKETTAVEIASRANKPRAELRPVELGIEWSEEAHVYHALILGLRDYIQKNRFSKVILGISGGIDSALVAAIAVDALGSENVIGVTMPSPFSSSGSVTDSEQLAHNFGFTLFNLTIHEIYQAFITILDPVFSGSGFDVTEENLQARIRGALVMALSNKFGWLPLATGNKSEVSVGYCTLYGDMAGGFAPLKDVFKTMVYRLVSYRNDLAGYGIIPQSIIDKAPSAELRPNQTDQDTLPPYELLDRILELYVEKELDVDEIVARGFESDVVKKVSRWVDGSEYKRRQAAPGTKITPRAFGKDRRMPITNRYRDQ